MSASPKQLPEASSLMALWCQFKAWFAPAQHGSVTVDPRLHMVHTHNTAKSQRLRRRTLTAYELPDATVPSQVCIETC
ncbi:hypothetical protein INT44_007155 [Umbelopsis vinacea]|uniref:Uncharacterized protein n=1 Tax=Umbelopsis vinacea TaxID=44442 RepID=A0A8H7PGJ4_9FUNG|nr:hypothetical protein INT44_007155 [Umbelopsis vinacea]